MPRIIAPRRVSKEVTVEEYWSFEDPISNKSISSKGSHKVFKQQQVAVRYRHSKPSLQSTNFNPLAWTIHRDSPSQGSQLRNYLSSVANRVSPSLVPIKKFNYGNQCLQNHAPAVITLLTTHLQCSDAWPLLRAFAQDAPNLNLWIQIGFPSIFSVSLLQRSFNQTLFRNLFDTFVAVMEIHYFDIKQNPTDFFNCVFGLIFTHPNKHASLFWKAFSLCPQNFKSQLMLNRLTVVRGSLTAQSMTDLVDTISNTNSDHSEFLSLLLPLLTPQELAEEVLFNLHGVLEGLLQLCRNKKLKPITLLSAIYHFFVGAKDFKGRNLRISQRTAEFAASVLTEYISELQPTQETLGLLARLLIWKVIPKSCEIVSFLRSASLSQMNLFAEQLLQGVSRSNQGELIGTVSTVVVACRPWLTAYLESPCDTQLMLLTYKMVLLMKEVKSHQLIEPTSLNCVSLSSLLDRFKSIASLLVFLRFSFFLKTQISFVQAVTPCFYRLIAPFRLYLHKVSQTPKSFICNSDYFLQGNFLLQQLLYSHHQSTEYFIQFNCIEAYLLLCNKMKGNQHEYTQRESPILKQMAFECEFLALHRPICFPSPNLLHSRHRSVRAEALKTILSQIGLSSFEENVFSIQAQIDKEEIDLNNERQVKRLFVNLIQGLQRERLSKLSLEKVVRWSLGFSFTGFQLISQSIIELLVLLLCVEGEQTCGVLLPFLQYCNYSLSRGNKTSTEEESILQQGINPCFHVLMKRDFNVEALDSGQNIGLQRVAEAIRRAYLKGAVLSSSLNQLIQAYFLEEIPRCRNRLRNLAETLGESGEKQFQRNKNGEEKKDMAQEENEEGKELQSPREKREWEREELQPPREELMKAMVKMCPVERSPPYECLHFIRTEVLEHPRIKASKTQPWDGHLDRVEWEEVRAEEMELCVHYLWKDVVEGNNRSRRVVVEMIRNHLPQGINLLFHLLLTLLHCEDLFNQENLQVYCNKERVIQAQTQLRLQRRWGLMHPNSLLNGVHVMKTMLESVRQWISLHLDQVVSILTAFFSFVHSKNHPYRNHRKQSFKIMLVLLRNYTLSPSQMECVETTILHELNPLHLQFASRNSVPGALTVLQVLVKSQNFIANELVIRCLSCLLTRDSQQRLASRACINISLNILCELLLQQRPQTIHIHSIAQQSNLLQSMYDLLEGGYRNDSRIYQLSLVLMRMHSQPLHSCWRSLLENELKRLSNPQLRKKKRLELIPVVELAVEYAKNTIDTDQGFKWKLMQLLSWVGEQREEVSLALNSMELGLSSDAKEVVSKLNAVSKKGLQTQMDFTLFFEGVKLYGDAVSTLPLFDRHFLLSNSVSFLCDEQPSVRKSAQGMVSSTLQSLHDSPEHQLLLTLLFETLRMKLRAGLHSSIVTAIGTLFHHIVNHTHRLTPLCSLIQEDFFSSFVSVSQNQQLKSIRVLLRVLESSEQLQTEDSLFSSNSMVFGVLLPMIEHLVLSGEQSTGNLSSTLTLEGLQVIAVMPLWLTSKQKQQWLNKTVAKLKKEDPSSKKSAFIVKLVCSFVEGLRLPKCTHDFAAIIEQMKLEQQNKRKEQRQFQAEEDQEPIDQKTDLLFKEDPQQFRNLRNMMENEEEEIMKQNAMVVFLENRVLPALENLLFYEAKDTDARVQMAVAVTKVLTCLSRSTFLHQLQKVVLKLAKLLRSRELQTRKGVRKALAEVLQTTGAALFYIVLSELKEGLRHSQEIHVLNYTVFYLLSRTRLPSASLDYCLPLLLPIVVDEFFGSSAEEKALVQLREIPVLNLESKQRKGPELLQLVCTSISAEALPSLLDYIRVTFPPFLHSEEGLLKFDFFLKNVLSGISRNEDCLRPQRTPFFFEFLSTNLKQFTPSLRNSCSVEKKSKIRKSGAKEAFELQLGASNNSSIYAAMKERTDCNTDTMGHSLVLMCLSLMNVLLKKKVLKEEGSNTIQVQEILKMVVECTAERDNRLVSLSLRITIHCLAWKCLVPLRSRVISRVLELIDQLTSADQELLRDGLTILNELSGQLEMTSELIGSLLTVVTLHAREDCQSVAPFKLMKTLVYKVQDLNTVLSLKEMAKSQLVISQDPSIRECCKWVIEVFLKHLPSREDIDFILVNLEHHHCQLLLLELLRQAVPGDSLQQPMTLIHLLTAMVNCASQHWNHFQTTLQQLVSKIDVSLCLQTVDSFLTSQRGAIRRCGTILLQAVLPAMRPALLVPRLQHLTLWIEEGSHIHVPDDKWNDILQQMETQIDSEQTQQQTLALTTLILCFKGIVNADFFDSRNLIQILWKTLQHQSIDIVKAVIEIIVSHNNPCTALQAQQECPLYDSKHPFSLRRTLNTLLNGTVNTADIVLLLNAIVNDYQGQNTASIKDVGDLQEEKMRPLSIIVNTLCNRLQRCLSQPTLVQIVMLRVYEILQQCVLNGDNRQQSVRLHCSRLLEITNKVSRNQFVVSTVQSLNETVCDVLKEVMGTAEYYRESMKVETDRRELKKQRKVALAQLAITNQQQFALQRKRRRIN